MVRHLNTSQYRNPSAISRISHVYNVCVRLEAYLREYPREIKDTDRTAEPLAFDSSLYIHPPRREALSTCVYIPCDVCISHHLLCKSIQIIVLKSFQTHRKATSQRNRRAIIGPVKSSKARTNAAAGEAMPKSRSRRAPLSL